MDLTHDQKLFLMSAGPGEVSAPLAHPAPKWLVQEMIGLGLVERIGKTSAWRLTAAGVEARRELVGE